MTEDLLKNELFNQNFTQILKVCEITNDCNISKNDFEKYKENRILCSVNFKFCKIEYWFYIYNDIKYDRRLLNFIRYNNDVLYMPKVSMYQEDKCFNLSNLVL